MSEPDGRIIVFSAPSGAGKTTIVNRLVEANSYLAFSVSATTRKPRDGETHGKDYYFFSPPAFKQKIAAGAFVEHEEVYPDLFYGTLREEVERIWREGRHVIADVDVKGGLKLKEYFGSRAIGIFVQPPSVETLRERLYYRATESEEALRTRFERASFELSYAQRFDRVLLNDQLEQAVQEAQSILDEFLSEVSN